MSRFNPLPAAVILYSTMILAAFPGTGSARGSRCWRPVAGSPAVAVAIPRMSSARAISVGVTPFAAAASAVEPARSTASAGRDAGTWAGSVRAHGLRVSDRIEFVLPELPVR